VRDFKKLKVWERSYGLTLAAYEATAKFPREELYGLTSAIYFLPAISHFWKRRTTSALPGK
jgi:hypothetical protein